MVWEGFPCANPFCPPTPFVLASEASGCFFPAVFFLVWPSPPSPWMSVFLPCLQDLKAGLLGVVLPTFRRSRNSCVFLHSGTFRNPQALVFLKSIAGTNGRRIVVQIGGVLLYKLEVYCGVSLSPKLRSQQGRALQMGGVMRYKLEMYH